MSERRRHAERRLVRDLYGSVQRYVQVIYLCIVYKCIQRCIQVYTKIYSCIKIYTKCSERKKITPTPNQANDLFARYETAKRKQTGAVKKRGKKATKKARWLGKKAIWMGADLEGK